MGVAGEYTDTVRGLTCELLSGNSALHMDPEPIVEPDGTFLAYTDAWVRHALEHYSSVYAGLVKLERELGALRDKMAFRGNKMTKYEAINVLGEWLGHEPWEESDD